MVLARHMAKNIKIIRFCVCTYEHDDRHTVSFGREKERRKENIYLDVIKIFPSSLRPPHFILSFVSLVNKYERCDMRGEKNKNVIATSGKKGRRMFCAITHFAPKTFAISVVPTIWARRLQRMNICLHVHLKKWQKNIGVKRLACLP